MKRLVHFFWRIFVGLTNPSCTIKSTELGKNIRLGKKVTIGRGSYVYTQSIGNYSFINKNCIIDKSVESIGSFCSIAYGAKLGLAGHPTNWVSSHPFCYDKKYSFVEENKFETMSTAPKGKIGNDVWIGANAIVLAGVKVGDGAIIGANAFVNEDVKPYSIVVGTPAKHQKFRFDEKTVESLQKLEWWKWDKSKLKRNIQLFSHPEKFMESIR